MGAVQGNRAAGTTDRGSPVKVGAVYQTTRPTLTDGLRGDAQVDSRGNLAVALYIGNDTIPIEGGALSADGVSGTSVGIITRTHQYVWNGASWDRLRGPNVIKTVAAVAITAATGVTIWTPAAGKKFRLMGWSLSSSAAAALIFGDNVVGTVILRSELLAAAGLSQIPPGFGNGFLSAAADNVLKLDVTANTTVSGYVFGVEE